MKNVCQKGGRLYYRRKVAGADTYIRLPNSDDPTFAEAYTRADKPDVGRAKPGAGTIGALVCTYRSSADHRNIRSAATRTNRSRYLDLIEAEHGHRSVAGVRPANVWKMRDDLADTPGKANNYITVFRLLMGYAARLDWRADNPAVKIPALPIGEHEPWPAEVLQRAIDAASPMTRLAIITGLCSGQRVGDVILMQHGWHDGAMMELRQSKTKRDVAIPMHPLWLAELGKTERKSITILYDRAGTPFGTTGAIQARLRTLMASIGAAGFTFHGLRKNAACYLTEMGLNETEIGGILGMSPDMVRHYSKRARTLMIAQGAAHRATRGDVLRLPAGQNKRSSK